MPKIHHMIKLNKLHFKIRISKKLFYAASSIFIATVLVITGYFLYKFVYKSIIYSEEIIIKKSLVSDETFKKEDFEKTANAIKEKMLPQDSGKIQKISNFFLENRIATSTPATASGSNELKKEGTVAPPSDINNE